MIVGLFHSLTETGGVQQASRLAAAALTRIARRNGLETAFLTLHDPLGRDEFGLAGTSIRFSGHGGSRAQLALEALRSVRGATAVYAAHPFLAGLVVPMTAFRPGLRTWVAVHGIDVWTTLPLLRRLGLRRATGVMPVSLDTAKKVVEVQGVAPERTHVVHNAIDPRMLAAGLSSDVPETPGLILTVSRLVAENKYKGIDTLIRAMPEIRRLVPNARLVVVGDGDDRSRLEAIARRVTTNGAVEFTGEVDASELIRRYRECQVFALPSLGEGFGIVFLEAMAFGKPTVAANAGGAPEIVRDGVTGIVVDPPEVGGVARAIASLLADERRRTSMGLAAKEAASTEFSFARFEQRLEELLVREKDA